MRITRLEKVQALREVIEDIADDLNLNIVQDVYKFPFGFRIVINIPNYTQAEHNEDTDHYPEP